MGFALSLVLALAITGLIWSLDLAVLGPMRRRRVEDAQKSGGAPADVARLSQEPLIVEYAKSFFPVILVVLVLRSFVVEPFRIPSGSMIPTLHVGDFILVEKFAYGLRLPVVNTKILPTGEPHRGDVMVFRYPRNPDEDFIKRVVGLPGDHIVYKKKELYINGHLVPRYDPRPYLYEESGDRYIDAREYTEKLGHVRHPIILVPEIAAAPRQSFVVPPHEYFVMGDNRDLSNDSRYWGYVPEKNLVGRAVLIWFSWDIAHGKSVAWRRIGRLIH
ncbi:MAG: signal peptidase I [Acidiferrobacteraceae bacterium]